MREIKDVLFSLEIGRHPADWSFKVHRQGRFGALDVTCPKSGGHDDDQVRQRESPGLDHSQPGAGLRLIDT
jgi:hypothetical protein